MSDQSQQDQDLNQPKKVSLADAIKNKLNQKKQQMNVAGKGNHQKAGNMMMKNQNNKKMNTMRRKTGGS